MKQSSRANRMARHHARNKKIPGLNLVSLMDIFTILVFFLLVNSAEVQTLETPRDIKLPESVSESKPRETVVVHVAREQVLVQGQPVASISDIETQEDPIIEPLRQALKAQTDRMLRTTSEKDLASREVTILGDRELPYRVLKKIMATCTEADYGKVSLAVIQKDDSDARQVAAAGM